ncbi:MAG: Phosphoheptose isomerase [Chlamydiae bacterium]|nr:Phosphoheptose isomerase [Chlamydiota bacterium]
MERKIIAAVEDGIRAIEQLRSKQSIQFITDIALAISTCYKEGGKLIIAGNGGSLCDAGHFAEELTGQFRQPRAALPAIALNDPGFLTCTANDFGFDTVFARGVAAYGKPEDIFIGLTTSGNSVNLIKAFELAKRKSLKTIAFLGKGGGALRGVADLELIIEGFETSDRIQEAHMTAIHIAIEMVEKELFYGPNSPFPRSLQFLPISSS